MEAFAGRLRRLREASGISQYRLAQLSGISKQGISKLEEEGSDPKLSTLVKLAGALGTSPRDLIPDGEVNSGGLGPVVNPSGPPALEGDVNSGDPGTGVNRRCPPAPAAADEFRRVCLPYLREMYEGADVNRGAYSTGSTKMPLFCLKEDVIDPGKGKSTEVDHIIAAMAPALRDLRKFHAEKSHGDIYEPRTDVVPLVNQLFQALGVEPSKMAPEEAQEHLRQSSRRRKESLARRDGKTATKTRSRGGKK